MSSEASFRTLFILSFIIMTGIRVYYHSKALGEQGRIEVREGPLTIVAGSIAALTTIVFGAEYIFSPGSFAFAYPLLYPDWLRWLGAILLAGGLALLAYAHHHLGRSFHPLVVSREQQVLVSTGPYRWIRHPVYTAYLANYVGGGLLSSNLVLTLVPATMYAILVAIRMGQEEDLLRERFPSDYVQYEKRTGRLLPRLGRKH